MKGSDAFVSGSFELVVSLLPNKPMVPTATNPLAEYPSPHRRRHIGEPFGGFSDQRADARDNGPRTMFDRGATRGMRAGGDRVLDNGLRAA